MLPSAVGLSMGIDGNCRDSQAAVVVVVGCRDARVIRRVCSN